MVVSYIYETVFFIEASHRNLSVQKHALECYNNKYSQIHVQPYRLYKSPFLKEAGNTAYFKKRPNYA
ncbi:hypothetical protein SAMN02787073_2550 [Chryseobacterium vrystaatense]|uniref:Uncharacterized protein n=1 Tax=Chryseobacterium vrystaatense TaxID=307480 RepID=A0A1M5DC52_9FLAO|nr:hypothetical protein SAMN02787073_2550 [Chryseobacterium vrystaatense]